MDSGCLALSWLAGCACCHSQFQSGSEERCTSYIIQPSLKMHLQIMRMVPSSQVPLPIEPAVEEPICVNATQRDGEEDADIIAHKDKEPEWSEAQ